MYMLSFCCLLSGLSFEHEVKQTRLLFVAGIQPVAY
jgi:hypothetical protein